MIIFGTINTDNLYIHNDIIMQFAIDTILFISYFQQFKFVLNTNDQPNDCIHVNLGSTSFQCQYYIIAISYCWFHQKNGNFGVSITIFIKFHTMHISEITILQKIWIIDICLLTLLIKFEYYIPKQQRYLNVASSFI